MACSIQRKTLKYLKDKDAKGIGRKLLSEDNRINNLSQFNLENDYLTAVARNDYGLAIHGDAKLFTIKPKIEIIDGVPTKAYFAEPNEKYFNVLDGMLTPRMGYVSQEDFGKVNDAGAALAYYLKLQRHIEKDVKSQGDHYAEVPDDVAHKLMKAAMYSRMPGLALDYIDNGDGTFDIHAYDVAGKNPRLVGSMTIAGTRVISANAHIKGKGIGSAMYIAAYNIVGKPLSTNSASYEAQLTRLILEDNGLIESTGQVVEHTREELIELINSGQERATRRELEDILSDQAMLYSAYKDYVARYQAAEYNMGPMLDFDEWMERRRLEEGNDTVGALSFESDSYINENTIIGEDIYFDSIQELSQAYGPNYYGALGMIESIVNSGYGFSEIRIYSDQENSQLEGSLGSMYPIGDDGFGLEVNHAMMTSLYNNSNIKNYMTFEAFAHSVILHELLHGILSPMRASRREDTSKGVYSHDLRILAEVLPEAVVEEALKIGSRQDKKDIKESMDDDPQLAVYFALKVIAKHHFPELVDIETHLGTLYQGIDQLIVAKTQYYGEDQDWMVDRAAEEFMIQLLTNPLSIMMLNKLTVPKDARQFLLNDNAGRTPRVSDSFLAYFIDAVYVLLQDIAKRFRPKNKQAYKLDFKKNSFASELLNAYIESDDSFDAHMREAEAALNRAFSETRLRDVTRIESDIPIKWQAKMYGVPNTPKKNSKKSLHSYNDDNALKQSIDEAKKITQKEAVAQIFPEEVEAARGELGEAGVAISLYLRRLYQARRVNGLSKGEVKAAIKKLGQEGGYLLTPNELSLVFDITEAYAGGNEATVYKGYEGDDHVYKTYLIGVNDSNAATLTSIESMMLANHLFPEAKETVIGVTERKGNLYLVTKQKFIKGERPSDAAARSYVDDIPKKLTYRIGGKKVNYTISDVMAKNLIQTSKGIVPIDLIISPNSVSIASNIVIAINPLRSKSKEQDTVLNAAFASSFEVRIDQSANEMRFDDDNNSELGDDNIMELGALTTETDLESEEADLAPITRKIIKAVNKIMDSMQDAISKLEYQNKGRKNPLPERVEAQRAINDTMMTIQEKIQKGLQVQGIFSYIDLMDIQMKSLEIQMLNKNPKDTNHVINLAGMYDDLLKTYAVGEDLTDVLTQLKFDKNQTVASEAEIDKAITQLREANGRFLALSKQVAELKRQALRESLNDIKYFPQIKVKHMERLRKKHSELGIQEDVDSWVAKQLQDGPEAEAMQAEVDSTLEMLLSSDVAINDIYGTAKTMSAPLNVNSDLVQIMNRMIIDINNERLERELVKDREFKELFEELVAEKGTKNPKKLYENILTYDATGKPYLRGKYSAELFDVIEEIYKEGDKWNKQIGEIQATTTNENSAENHRKVMDLIRQRDKAVSAIAAGKVKLGRNNVIIGVEDSLLDNRPLSPAEAKVLAAFQNIIIESERTIGASNSLRFTPIRGVEFFRLPAVTKTDVERIWGGVDVVGAVKDKWKDITEIRADDTEFVEERIDANGETIKKIRIHYRNPNITGKDQSIDLFKIFRLEYKNINQYRVKRNSERLINFLVDIAKEKPFVVKKGFSKLRKVFSTSNEPQEKRGADSNVYKMMVNMLESRFYDIMNVNEVKVGPADANKVVNMVNGASSFLALSLNMASATANVLNANAQIFLESFVKGEFIKAGSVAKANKIYTKHIPDNLADTLNPINGSYINKMHEYYNTFGLVNFSDADFIKADMMKKGLSSESLQVLQESGEHWIQSVIVMSVLDGIKVMDKDNDFIDKDGNKVKSKKQAASLLDMMVEDEATGHMRVHPAVVYTSVSQLTAWDKGGKAMVDSLIHKQLYNLIGNYRPVDQPEVFRHWYGKLFMLFRKYLIPMGQARWRGAAYIFTDRNNLRDDQKIFSYALQRSEEGTYTTMLRFAITNLMGKKKWLLQQNWSELSDWEKHNIRKSITETVLVSALSPVAAMVAAALAEGDDSEWMWFMVYELRRLDTELSAYRDPSEMFKTLRSPIPSARLVETSIDLITGAFNPASYTEDYKSGINKGRNKYFTKIEKQIPVLKEYRRTYEDLYEFQKSSIGTGTQ